MWSAGICRGVTEGHRFGIASQVVSAAVNVKVEVWPGPHVSGIAGEGNGISGLYYISYRESGTIVPEVNIFADHAIRMPYLDPIGSCEAAFTFRLGIPYSMHHAISGCGNRAPEGHFKIIRVFQGALMTEGGVVSLRYPE